MPILDFFRQCSNFVIPGHNFSAFYLQYPSRLSEEYQVQLFDRLLPVAMNAFGCETDNERRQDVWNHVFLGQNLVIVVDKDVPDSKLVAFWVWDRVMYGLCDSILYLRGICVVREYQNKGIGTRLLQFIFYNDHNRSTGDVHQFCPLPDSKYIVMRTQNPVMKIAFDKAVGKKSYPHIGIDTPQKARVVAEHIACKHLKDPSYESALFLSQGVYGTNLYGYIPCSGIEEYDTIFKNLNYNAGDALVFVWLR